MSESMLTDIEAITKGEECIVPAMKFSELEGFMRAFRSAQKRSAMQCCDF